MICLMLIDVNFRQKAGLQPFLCRFPWTKANFPSIYLYTQKMESFGARARPVFFSGTLVFILESVLRSWGKNRMYKSECVVCTKPKQRREHSTWMESTHIFQLNKKQIRRKRKGDATLHRKRCVRVAHSLHFLYTLKSAFCLPAGVCFDVFICTSLIYGCEWAPLQRISFDKSYVWWWRWCFFCQVLFS